MSNSLHVPFETTLLVRDTCLCLHVQRAARALARRFDEALRPVGLTNGQFSLMLSLNRPSPPPMKPVAELLAMDQTTLTAALKPLQRQGWVEILVNPDDRRERLLQLTPLGKETLAAAVPIWKATHADIEVSLIGGNGDTIRRDLISLSR
ncbi:MarR family transcriptional regulator [Ochrobactrum sp. CM-21-5]|nr:MarR family transcriptional regulator [Ochrobactrum sp. CM-21-5]MBC2885280.1 MarR family transcriptional regulator [Ochrobactrum sp. CM-21-5]